MRNRNNVFEKKMDDRMIKQLLNSVITKYHDLPVSRRSIIWIIELLTTDKSRYFAQPRPIIVKYFTHFSILKISETNADIYKR